MYILNIADTVTKCQSMNSEILSLKTIMNELDLLKRKVIIQWKVWKKRLAVVCNQINRKKYLIPVMLKNIIIHLYERKTQNH